MHLQRRASCCWSSTTSSTCSTAAPLVAELLAACPRLTVLATSRAPLRVCAASSDCRCRRWRCPDPDRLPDLEELAAYAAVRLFVAAGAGGRAGLRLDRRRTPPRWPRSAAGWTGCRWRSSWRRRGHGCCRRRRCWPGWSSRLPLLTGGPRDAAGAAADDARRDRLEPRPAVTRTSSAVPAAGRLRRRLHAGGGGGGWPGPGTGPDVARTGSPRWSTRACCGGGGRDRTASRASGCWRRSASTGWSGWQRAGRRRRSGTGTRPGASAWPSGTGWRRPPGWRTRAGWRASRRSTTTCGRPWPGWSGPATGRGCCGWRGRLQPFWDVRGHRAEAVAWLERGLARGQGAPPAGAPPRPGRARTQPPTARLTTRGPRSVHEATAGAGPRARRRAVGGASAARARPGGAQPGALRRGDAPD